MLTKPVVFLRKITILLLIFNLLCCLSLSAQNAVDSLENVLNTQKLAVSQQLDLYYQISWGSIDVDIEKAFMYAKKGIKLAEKENDKAQAARLYNNLGVAYDMMNEADSAMICFNKALDFALNIKNGQSEEARSYTCIGNFRLGRGEYPQALEYYLKALPYYEKSGNKERIGALSHNIGVIYQTLLNYEQALKYYLKEETLAREIGDKEALAHALVSISGLWLKTDGDKERMFDYALEAVNLFKELNNKYAECCARQSLAKIYYYHNNFPPAFEHAQIALELSKELGYPNLIARSYYILSGANYYKGNYAECEAFALKALETDSTNIDLNCGIITNIAYANAKMGNADKAIAYFEKYSALIFEQTTEDYQRSLSEMEVKYETEKKEMKIAVMEEEQRLYIWLGISIGVALLLALITFIIRQRLAVSRRKLSEQQVKQLEQEKQLIATQAILDGETSERTRLAKDLHDGLGGMLSVVKLNLYDVKKGVTLENEDVQRFDQALNMLNDSIIELRRVAHNMMPDSLTRYGLKVALTDFCNSIPYAEFHYFGSGDRLNPKLEVMIYRIVHELVNNAMKHSHAEHILVQIVQEDERISITVQDNGCGFNPSLPTTGIGLNNIRDRVHSFNGQISVWSEIGKGTEISVELRIEN